MGSVIDLSEPAGIDVAVGLRRRERAVAEKLLDHAQVGATLEEVRRECVPESVGVRGGGAGSCSCRAAGRAPRGRGRRPRRPRAPAATARDSGGAGTPPPRRAGRPAPCRPCHGRGRPPARSRHRRGRGRRPRGCAVPPSRRARARRGCGSRAARRPSPARGRRRPPRPSAHREPPSASRAELAVGNAARPEREAKEGANRGELAGDRRASELSRGAPRPVGAELSRVGAQRRGIDRRKRSAPRTQPRGELLDVHAVRAPSRLGEIRCGEKPLDERTVGHRTGFAMPPGLPAERRLADGVDDLFGEARELRQELGAGVLETLDPRVALLLAAQSPRRGAAAGGVDVLRVDAGHRRRDQ